MNVRGEFFCMLGGWWVRPVWELEERICIEIYSEETEEKAGGRIASSPLQGYREIH
jgi:hypothetical protein